MTTTVVIVLCTIFLTTYANIIREPIKVLDVNGCALKYKKDVPDKPDIFLTTVIIPGVCRIQKHQHESTENYEMLKVEYYKKESEYEYEPWARGPVIPGTIQKMNVTNYQGLSYDINTKSLMYIARKLMNFKQEKFIRRSDNDSQLVDEFILRNRYQNSALKGEQMSDLAYDWLTKNLFVNNKKGISVMNLNKPWEPIDVILGTSFITSFAIHPNAGYIFYVDSTVTDKTYEYTTTKDGLGNLYYGDYTNIIYRTNLDGSNKIEIGPNITHRDATITNLAIDYYTDRLYWSLPYMYVVQSSNLDGSDVKTVFYHDLRYGLDSDAARSISFDKKYIYILAGDSTVYRFDKQTMKKDEDFKIYNQGAGIVAEIMVHDPEAFKFTADHPCSIDNGGCEQYCLALPKDHVKGGLARTCRGSNTKM